MMNIRSIIGKTISAAIVAGALYEGTIVVRSTSAYPRTDDAEVLANFIGMAPLVEGPVMQLVVHDNEFVKKGQLLYKIDDRPYLYALQRARAAQQELEGQIQNEGRRIAAQKSAVGAAQAATMNAQANEQRAEAEISVARAAILEATAALQQAKSDASYAVNNLNRLEPLLAKQFVTPDEVDRARTLAETRNEAARRAESQLELMKARLSASEAQKSQASSLIVQSTAQLEQSSNAVLILDPLIADRENRAATVRRAQYDYENCSIYAPFDARVTNLTVSEGQYVKAGQQLFTLIDTRIWWVMANFRETQLRAIRPGSPADVYVMSDPTHKLEGVVESLGFGVTPDPDVIGKMSSGLPETQRTLNWVRLASRYPVRIRIVSPPSDLMRVSEVAAVVMRPEKSEPQHVAGR